MSNRTLLHISFILIILLGISSGAVAQIHMAGLVDIELRKGGADSSPYTNQSPGDKLSLFTPNVRLFLSGNISDQWFVSSVLQSDYYNSKELHPPFFSVLSLNFTPHPDSDSDFMATIGRFVTPYGAYSKRLLSSNNPFVHLPLTHASGLPVTKHFGFVNTNSNNYNDPYYYNLNNVYFSNETGLTMVYQRMYTQGIKISGSLGENNTFNYNLAATLAPASSHFEYGEYDTPSFIGRVTLQPAMWARLGLSYSSGPFMKKGNINRNIFSDNDLSSYTQRLIGADVRLSYHYYTVLMEYNHSYWEAPLVNLPPGNPITLIYPSREATIDHLSGEFVVDLPFWVGSYAAIRYEALLSGEMDNYTSVYNGDSWTYDRRRIEFAAGYSLHRNITLKASYLYSDDSGPNLDDNVIALQLSVLF
ncbi:MAG: hypothetical protein FH748_14045 [Balneolaceae bacterium]|nr:hypothetical protein [Balneolaceae bacterium]